MDWQPHPPTEPGYYLFRATPAARTPLPFRVAQDEAHPGRLRATLGSTSFDTSELRGEWRRVADLPAVR